MRKLGKHSISNSWGSASDETRRVDGDTATSDPVDGAIAFRDVRFGYDRDPVIRDLNFEVGPGETLGVVGATGAGKSTLLKLLLRFYDPDSGQIEIDGRDVADTPIGSVREAIGYVSQESYLFDGTVAENITYGREGADENAIEDAARAAGAHEFISNLEDGYDTPVGEQGAKLSGGQRQRISIARALVRDAPILVFDEATSNIDNCTEAIIQRSLHRVTSDRTTLIIAHRLSTVRNADQIIVLDDGEIRERGTHEDLIEADGLYADLWHIQIGEASDRPVCQ